MGSYSDEQGFYSYFKIVECGPNYKLLNINPFWKILSVERSFRCFHDGWPSYVGRLSYIGITFLDLNDTMDELEMIQLLVHHQDGILNLNWKQKEKDAKRCIGYGSILIKSKIFGAILNFNLLINIGMAWMMGP